LLPPPPPLRARSRGSRSRVRAQDRFDVDQLAGFLLLPDNCEDLRLNVPSEHFPPGTDTLGDTEGEISAACADIGDSTPALESVYYFAPTSKAGRSWTQMT